MHTLFHDLRYAFRQLLANPGFALTAVISLALGIGATTAVFSVIYAALINPYPFPHADRIMRLSVRDKAGDRGWVSLSSRQIKQLRQSPAIDSLVAMDSWAMTMTGGELPEEVNVIFLTPNGFNFLGVPAWRGRGLVPSDAVEGGSTQPVAVLGYRFWRRHFNSNPAVLGQILQMEHKNYTIVGIAAPRFRWYSADVYIPLDLNDDPVPIYTVDFRLKPGESRAAADAALQPIMEELARETPKHFPEHFKVDVEGLNYWVTKQIGRTLYLLLGAVGLLLAIGCSNVSILLLSRGTARQHELAVRAAIGASRGRLVRQLLTEALLLSVTGAGLGVGVAYGMLAGIQAVLPPFAFPPEMSISINAPVLWFCVGIALLTGIQFGLWPALQLSRSAAAQTMQVSARKMIGSVSGHRTHTVLIAGQIALTLLLLGGAATAREGLQHLMRVPLGYDPHHVMSVGIPIEEGPHRTWGSRSAYIEQLQAAVAATPGVMESAITDSIPPRERESERFEIHGRSALEQQTTLLNLVSPGYFHALRIPLVRGRVWSEAENRAAAHVAVINETMARIYFPNGNPIGQSIRLPGLENRPPIVLSAPGVANTWLQIVGIVADYRNAGLREPAKPEVFVPWTACMWEYTEILVRSNVPPLSLVHSIRKQLTTVRSDQEVGGEVSDLEQWIRFQPEWQQNDLIAWTFGAFSILALALAAAGLYSVVSYSVTQRTNEFGIRMALGAQRSHVLRIVFASMLVSVGTGILVGIGLNLALYKVFAAWEQGGSRDPITLLAPIGLLIVVAGIACAVPARRASKLEPMTALRSE
ncbi:MAG: ABC transporter permease [Acidobacteriaceae bacterium]